MAKTFYLNKLYRKFAFLQLVILQKLTGQWKKVKNIFIKSYIILLLDSGKCVQKVLKHGTTKFDNCHMICQVGPEPPGPPFESVPGSFLNEREGERKKKDSSNGVKREELLN